MVLPETATFSVVINGRKCDVELAGDGTAIAVLTPVVYRTSTWAKRVWSRYAQSAMKPPTKSVAAAIQAARALQAAEHANG